MEKRISLIVTVLNEEKTILKLLESVAGQTRKPDEIIIVDGGSKDQTVKLIKDFRDIEGIKIIEKKGNRAVGRNEAIRKANGEVICITDAGCELDEKWVEEITRPFKDESFIRRPPAETLRSTAVPLRGRGDAFNRTEVVAGYYKVKKDASIFQKCVACYALVMPDKINSNNFLPSSRSMAIRKSVWDPPAGGFGGFPEEFKDNEDYVFAQKLKKGGARIKFVQDALVFWQPRRNLKDFFNMIYRFARGDGKAGLRKRKVATVFGRYLVLGFLGLLGWLGYGTWAIWKNYKYVKNWQAILILPVLQIVSDLAVMGGTIAGSLKKDD